MVNASKSPGDLGHPDRAEAGLLGRLGIGDQPRDLVPVPALLRADHQADPHPDLLATAGARTPTLAAAGGPGNPILILGESRFKFPHGLREPGPWRRNDGGFLHDASRRRARRRRSGLAQASGLAEPERRAHARGAARAATAGCGLRADRREGHERVHDPGGRRPLEAVAARVLPVLRRQGRAALRAARGEHPRVGRGSPRGRRRPQRSRSSGFASSRSVSTNGASRSGRGASAEPTIASRSRSSRCSSRSRIPSGWPP